jgi:hypothetical protein
MSYQEEDMIRQQDSTIAFLIVWFFGLFLYYKVAFDATFSANLTALADCIIALFTLGIMFLASGGYAFLRIPYIAQYEMSGGGKEKLLLWALGLSLLILSPFILVVVILLLAT